MANFLSEPSEIATYGERLFFFRIRDVFENADHLIVYTEPVIKGLHPDYLLLSPEYGIFIVEIKDYSPKKIKTISKSGKWQYISKSGEIRDYDNPFDQLYRYWRAVKDGINHCHFPKDINVPIKRIAVFTNVPVDSEIAEIINKSCPQRIFTCFKQHITRNKQFKSYMEDLIPKNLNLSEEYFQTLRGNIIPSSRLPTTKQKNLDKWFTVEERVKLLDQKQEKLARELGEGHRLIFGVAGSGKTIVLIARARHLALQHPDWRILILCYNKFLKQLLYHLLNPQDYEADITIDTFHGWARKYILSCNNNYTQIYLDAEKKARKDNNLHEFFQEFVPNLLLNVLNQKEDKKVYYDSILIDEGQDFEADWFCGIIKVLNPQTNSLLITCDGLQGIYAQKDFRWIDVGIQARGRVRRFEKSYRTPIEIGAVAQKTIPPNLVDMLDKHDEFISTKEFIGNHGSVEVLLAKNRENEYRRVAKKLTRLTKYPQEILILFKYNMAKRNYEHRFFELLREYEIQWDDLRNNNYKTPNLLVGTLHGTKGLEFDTIIIPEVDTFNSDSDRQLLYVGITRSKEKVILSASKLTDLVKSILNEGTSVREESSTEVSNI